MEQASKTFGMIDNITQLPEEILVEIFKFIYLYQDIRKVGLVCKLWHRVAWGSRTRFVLRKFPKILEDNQLQYLLHVSPHIDTLEMPLQTTDNHVCKIGYCLPHLKHLYLRRCREVTNVGLGYLSSLKLEGIYLSTSWNISSLDFLVNSISSLRILEIRGCDIINDDAFESLHSLGIFENVKYLDMRDCTSLSSISFDLIAEIFPNIKHLDVSGCSITDDNIKSFKNLEKLQRLFLWGVSTLTDESLEIITQYKNLKQLSIIECDSVTNQGLKSLSRSKTIESIELGSRGISNDGIDFVFKIQSLKQMNVIALTHNIVKDQFYETATKYPEIKSKFAEMGIEEGDTVP